VWATTKPLRPTSCALWVLAIASSPTHLQPDRLSSNSICTTNWYVKTSLYHILSQVVPIQAHACTIFMGGRSMNRYLDLGTITNQELSTTTKHNPELLATTRHSFQTCHPKSLSLQVAKGLPTEQMSDIR
jgi:hypothetical protein